ncbi:MFS transporter [Bacillus sp. CECT 9360]|uniref:MDR family MFS transporter n=1 Tax=Bacillus sp. CECT 9360 TaxID=2845821 RepID=UPI001E5B0F6A|nr:MFS transporter [Bacillus sp. CECT 9360]CAH0346806.1 Multidrug resistance protein MdtH [Bacillus sp. CECT 9360]
MPRSFWLLIIGMIINVTASSFLWPLNTIFIHDQLGKSLSVAGLVLMANALASVIGNLIGGSLFDKIGGYKTSLAGIVITLISSLGLTINHEWIPYIVFLTLSGFGTGIVFPAIFAMAGTSWKEGGRKAFNAIYVAQNLGVAIGSALGGVIASISFEYIFAANTGLYLLFMLLAFFGFKGMDGEAGSQTSILNEQRPLKNSAKLNALFILCIGYFLCWVGYVQWQSTIAAYTQEIGISLKQYSLLWTINGALIVLAQPIVTAAIKWFAKTLKVQLIAGMLTFIVSFSVAANANGFAGLLTAMVILTIGEMFVWPAVPAVANDLAVKGREGFYQGVVNSTATAGRMIGPLLGGFLVDFHGMNMMFSVLSVLFVVAIMTTILFDRRLRRSNDENRIISQTK